MEQKLAKVNVLYVTLLIVAVNSFMLIKYVSPWLIALFLPIYAFIFLFIRRTIIMIVLFIMFNFVLCVRLVEEAVLKTVGLKRFRGSIPLHSVMPH